MGHLSMEFFIIILINFVVHARNEHMYSQIVNVYQCINISYESQEMLSKRNIEKVQSCTRSLHLHGMGNTT